MLNYSESDDSILRQLGLYVQGIRLEQNKSQQEVAAAAGLNRSTISQLEKGAGGTLSTFVRVLRVLNRLEQLAQFTPITPVSPLLLAKMEQKKRKRARSKGGLSDDQLSSAW